MFGHRPVGWGRHAGAIFAAAFVSSAAQAAVAMLTTLTAMRMMGASLGAQPLTAVAVALLILWLSLFLIVFAELAIGFTLARAALTPARRNFGAAYLASGLVIGMIEAKVVTSFKGAATPADFVFAAATGLLGGFVYWLVAARDREVVTREAQARAAAAFT